MERVLKLYNSYKMNIKWFVNSVLLAAVALFFTHCANVGSPTGGIKDEIPPVVESSKPAAGELGVNTQKVSIKFDEIIVLKNMNDNFLVSPPTKEKPEVKAYGKELTIEFQDTLQSNAVYTIYFGNAIVDNNEGNIMTDYSLSFSTGMVLDTMRLQGRVLDAKGLYPEAGIIVGIYSNFEDSTFISDVPLRIAKTNKEGYFSVNNVKPGTYIVRALADVGSDYRFNEGGEKIAFLDTRFETSQKTVTLMDSIFEDSIGKDKEVLPIFKGMEPRDTIMYLPDDIMLLAFSEERFFQTLKKKERKSAERIDFAFSEPIQDMPTLKLLEDTMSQDWYITELSADSTSLCYWITDTALIALDTVNVIFDYQKTDTLDQLVWKTDTVQMLFKHPKKSAKDKRKEERKNDREKDDKKENAAKKATPISLEITANSSVNYFDDIYITCAQPLAKIDASDFRLCEEINDTTKKELKFKFKKDEEKPRTYRIEYIWDQEKKYQLAVDSGKIYDIYGKTNDSIGYNFSIVKEDQFSTIFLNITNLKRNAVVQLLNAQQEVVDEVAISSNQEIGFYYLKPAKYYVSLFYDDNNNGKWDTGKYSEKRQAEEVRFFSKVIEAKAYYEMVEDWDLEEIPLYEQRPVELKPLEKKKK